MLRIAVVGTDGSGKSTLVRRAAARAGGGLQTMTCPAYHDTGNAPLHELSRALDALSSCADGLRSPGLKAAAMYLQMSLYGPVERFLVETLQPEVLLSERHAIVDPIAYSPLYRRMMGPTLDRGLEARVVERLGAPAWAQVVEWQARESRRLGVERTLWDLPRYLLELSERPWDQLLGVLGADFRCGLPDVVVLLDLPVTVALERVSGRAGAREVHEGAAMLEALRGAYHAELQVLAKSGVRTEVIDGSAGTPDDLVTALLERVGLSKR
jgi:hypothetical protein